MFRDAQPLQKLTLQQKDAGAPLAEVDWNTVYASGPAGYTDYPALELVAD